MTIRTKTLNDLFKQIYNKKYQSVWTCCLGQNQSGKTDFNLLQIERLHKLGLGDGFGSNIKGLKADFEIDFIEDFETLKKRCQMLNPDPEAHGIKRYFFVADEMGDWAPRDQPWLNVKFIKELQQVRKYGLSLLGSGISRIDNRILNEKHFHGYFEKVNKARPDLAIYYDWFNRRKVTIHGIPPTNIIFNTWYSASFFMESQTPNNGAVPLDLNHEIVKKYLECGGWKKAGIHTQTGINAVKAVLDFHMKHCIRSLQEPLEGKAASAAPDID